jgi:hypothetical protein
VSVQTLCVDVDDPDQLALAINGTEEGLKGIFLQLLEAFKTRIGGGVGAERDTLCFGPPIR